MTGPGHFGRPQEELSPKLSRMVHHKLQRHVQWRETCSKSRIMVLPRAGEGIVKQHHSGDRSIEVVRVSVL